MFKEVVGGGLLQFFLVLMCVLPLVSEAGEECADKGFKIYNITASDSHNFVWFRVAKVGTRSILEILQERTQLSINNYGVPFNPARFKDHFKFAFVRNPWDRVVSTYCNMILTRKHKFYQQCFGKDFSYFVDFINKRDLTDIDVHIMLQSKLIPLESVDFIGRFERFDEDLRLVLQVLGLDDVAIPHKNASAHPHYSRYYSEKTKKIIAKKYKADIEAFGYVFEEG